MLDRRLSGKAMVYSLLLATLVSLVTGLFIMSSHLGVQRLDSQMALSNLEDNLLSGTELLRSVSLPSIVETRMDLYEQGDDSIIMKKTPWGLYDAASVTALPPVSEAMPARRRSMLMGSPSNEQTDAALYLLDRNRPLSMAGNARIAGDALLPAAGAKRATVGGRPFSGGRLVDGATLKSRRRMPQPDTSRLTYLLSLFDMKAGRSTVPKKLLQPFADSLLVVGGQNLLLEGQSIRGHVLIQATEAIHVSGNCVLEDALLVAPSISFGRGFTGVVQAVALDSIVLGQDVQLGHPSSLVLLRLPQSVAYPHISLSHGAVLHGNMAIIDKKRGDGTAKLRMEEESLIRGMAHVDGIVELGGTVQGHLATRAFLLKTPSTIYDNYIMDGIIDRKALPGEQLFPPFYPGMASESVIKWTE